jgi:alpha-methylacyl-CoA racemase
MGPLTGIRIIEMVGLRPTPYCGMLLADFGAEVIAVDRAGPRNLGDLPVDITRRNKQSVIVDIKAPAGKKLMLKLCESADGLIEGFRPGVMEKLGLGPEQILGINPRLVYGRMTGFGQTGPLAQAAGHDINYSALAGVLWSIGDANQPPPPLLNLIADMGGDGMMLAFGMLAALLETKTSGRGQVVDAAMIEGAVSQMAVVASLYHSRQWAKQRAANMLDGDAHFYGVFETSDQKYVAIGAIELPFMQVLVDKLKLDTSYLEKHYDPASWPEFKKELATIFRQRTQTEWCDLLEGSDACFAPVLPFWESHLHPQFVARNSFVEIDGAMQMGPVPKFERTPGAVRSGPVAQGANTDKVLRDLGLSEQEIETLKAENIVRQK